MKRGYTTNTTTNKQKEIFNMSVFTITKENFEAEVLNATQPVLVDFWASWCGPCKMLSPTVDRIAQEHSEIKVGKINVDEQPSLAAAFNVMSIPTLLLFKQGKVVATSVGLKQKAALEQFISQ
ncbi:MAG: thioredoxin [Pygmaiobacter sp.]